MRASTTLVLLISLMATGQAQAEFTPELQTQTADVHLPQDYQREQEPWLTHDEAILRSRTLSNVVYHLDIT